MTTNKGHNMSEKMTGSKYDSSMDIAQVAKLVRAELKAETKAGRLPKGVKYSVRTSRYSMGCSLTVEVKAVPQGFGVVNPHRAWLDHDDPHFAYHTLAVNDPRYPRLTAEAAELVASLERLVNQYNRKDIDSMTDYYNVSFSEHVGFAYEVEQADRERVLAEPRPELPSPAPLASGEAATDDEPEPEPEPAPSCQVVELPTAKLAREQGAQAALKADDAARGQAPQAAPKAAQAPAQAATGAASEYTAAALADLADWLAKGAGVELVSWSIRVHSSGRVQLVVEAAKKTTVNGREVTVESTLTCAL